MASPARLAFNTSPNMLVFLDDSCSLLSYSLVSTVIFALSSKMLIPVHPLFHNFQPSPPNDIFNNFIPGSVVNRFRVDDFPVTQRKISIPSFSRGVFRNHLNAICDVVTENIMFALPFYSCGQHRDVRPCPYSGKGAQCGNYSFFPPCTHDLKKLTSSLSFSSSFICHMVAMTFCPATSSTDFSLIIARME